MPAQMLTHGQLPLHGPQLFDYLCFAFEKVKHEGKCIETENYAVFNTGIGVQEEIYAYFEPNRNQKQQWCLAVLGTREVLPSNVNTDLPDAACHYSDFNKTLWEFAYAPDKQYSFIVHYFDDNIRKAKTYIEEVFSAAFKLGFIAFEEDVAVMNTGIVSESELFIYALFERNRFGRQEWYLKGFFDKPRGISRLPECVIASEQNESEGDRTALSPISTNSVEANNGTLLVTAIPVEYNALLEVLKDKNIDFEEKSENSIGNREFRYIHIKTLNTIAILAGQSFECIIPIIQSILAFKPLQAILSGIAFSFDMSKAPYNSIVVSKSVFDYESAKINEEGTNHRGNKLPASINLRQLYTDQLARGVVIKNGDYASGMKVVNSIKYQQELKEFMPELLAGDEEGFFFAHSCNEFRVDWIVIKAISDYGVGKTDDIQKTAAYAALDYTVKGLLRQNARKI